MWAQPVSRPAQSVPDALPGQSSKRAREHHDVEGDTRQAELDDIRGQADWTGRELLVTTNATADQMAAAAGMLMVKNAGVPAVWISGQPPRGDGKLADILRDPASDLFR